MRKKDISYNAYNEMVTHLWETIGVAEQNEQRCRVSGDISSAEQCRRQALGLITLIRDLQGGNPYAP